MERNYFKKSNLIIIIFYRIYRNENLKFVRSKYEFIFLFWVWGIY